MSAAINSCAPLPPGGPSVVQLVLAAKPLALTGSGELGKRSVRAFYDENLRALWNSFRNYKSRGSIFRRRTSYMSK